MAQATPTTSVIGGGMQGSDGMVWEIYFLSFECNELDRKYSPIINGQEGGGGLYKTDGSCSSRHSRCPEHGLCSIPALPSLRFLWV